jgi:hypothetical protein
MIPKSGHRFPACAKPRHILLVWTNTSAGVGRSDKIMLKTNPLPKLWNFFTALQ